MATQIKYGNYSFLGTWYPKTVDRSTLSTVVQIPRRDGGVALKQRRKPGKIILAGGFHQNEAGAADLQSTLDALHSALDAGPANLQLDSNRLYKGAVKTNAVDSYDPTGYNDYVSVQVEFDLPDPIQYGTATVTDSGWTLTGNAPLTHTTNVATGNYFAEPVIVITLAAAAACNFTLTNLTTGESCTVIGTPAGTTITMDGSGNPKTVQSNGADAMSLFDGLFLTLLPGNNSLQLTINSGNAAAISSIVPTWTPRWS